MDLKTVCVQIPDGANIILGQTHFIKTAEDLYEILAGASPHIKFGLAFYGSVRSVPYPFRRQRCRFDSVRRRDRAGNWRGSCVRHLLREAFPINVLNSIKMCPEVCRIYCATANPLEVVVAQSEQGGGIMGVIDGSSPKGVETDADKAARKALLRNFGYKVKS
jgi:adenosine/AMP kinase